MSNDFAQLQREHEDLRNAVERAGTSTAHQGHAATGAHKAPGSPAVR